MIEDLLTNVTNIYISYGYTDFRKQSNSLVALVESKFKQNPYNGSAFIFCNKGKNSIKVLAYDDNGFVLAQKNLLNADKMKFIWPKDKSEMELITKRQLKWLLTGLTMYPKKSFKNYDFNQQKPLQSLAL